MPKPNRPYAWRPTAYLAAALLFAAASAAAAGLTKHRLRGKINRAFMHQATPSVSADGRELYFMIKNPADADSRRRDDWDIHVSKLENGLWTEGEPLASINSEWFEGYPSLTADGQYLYFVANTLRDFDGAGKLKQDLDIYVSRKSGKDWGAPVRLPEGINFKGSDESGAAISPDGNTLVYFSEVGVGGKGGFDIYSAAKRPDGQFGLAQNIGAPINGASNETAPYFAPDGVSLYFSSDRPGGSGGFDFYRSQIQNGRWGAPRNLGPGINTPESDLGLSIAGNGVDVYLSGKDAYQTWILYRSELPSDAKPDVIVLLKGSAVDSGTGAPVGANLALEDLDTGQVLTRQNLAASAGLTALVLKEGHRYAVTLDAPGYFLYADNLDLKRQAKYREESVTWRMARIAVGARIVLNNIFFQAGSPNLDGPSRLALDKLAAQIKAHPALKLEIGGHTDSLGQEPINVKLSTARAEEVLKYLATKGIDRARFTVMGYGSSRQIDATGTPEGRARNRRTEFTVLAK